MAHLIPSTLVATLVESLPWLICVLNTLKEGTAGIMMSPFDITSVCTSLSVGSSSTAKSGSRGDVFKRSFKETFHFLVVCELWMKFRQITNCDGFIHSQGIGFDEDLLLLEPFNELGFVFVKFDVVDGAFAA